MLFTGININKVYFYMPFGPVILKESELGLKRSFFSPYYIDSEGGKWSKRLLFDTGWGRPYGFERIPELDFPNLITLVLLTDPLHSQIGVRASEANQYGAVSVIMEKYIPELLNFLTKNIRNKEVFCNPLYIDNLKKFCFSSSSNIGGGDGIHSYEDILNGYESWHKISSDVLKAIYGDGTCMGRGTVPRPTPQG